MSSKSTGQGQSYHGSILLRAQGNISTKTVRIDGGLGDTSVKTGGIQIDANMSGAPVEFVIGGPSANGVDGSLIATSSIGGGTLNNFMYGGVMSHEELPKASHKNLPKEDM